jgi:hypothetical protein
MPTSVKDIKSFISWNPYFKKGDRTILLIASTGKKGAICLKTKGNGAFAKIALVIISMNAAYIPKNTMAMPVRFINNATKNANNKYANVEMKNPPINSIPVNIWLIPV